MSATLGVAREVVRVETISQRQMRNESGEILRRVQAGESFIITNNGVEVAKLVPYASASNSDRDELIARGMLVNRKTHQLPWPKPVKTDIDLGAVLDELRGDR